MNQILSTEMAREKKSKNSKTIELKKVIIFFAIVIIIFGLVIGVNAAITLITKTKEDKEIQQMQTEPDVVILEKEEELSITIDHDKAITKITYKWDDGQEILINGNNRTSITQTIPYPSGTHTLTLNVTDEISSVATITKQFTKVEGEISLSFALVENKIKIIAKDSKEMSYLTYRWNSEMPTTVKVEEDADDKQTLELEVEIPEGLNTLTVVATNKSGQTKTKKQDIEGVSSPKVTVGQDGEYLILNVKDQNGVTLIDYMLNEQHYRIDLTLHDATYWNAIDGLTVKTNSEGNMIEVEYRQLMNDKGINVLKLTAENKKNAKATFGGQCNNL